MADVNTAKAHIEAAAKVLRESSAASFPETFVSKAIESLNKASAALSSAPAAAAPAFSTGTPVAKK